MYCFNDFNQFHSMQAHNTSTSHLELPLGHLKALCCSIYRHYCYGKHSLRIAPRMVCTARVGQPRRSSGPRGCRLSLRGLSPRQIGSEWWLTYFCLSITWTSAVCLAAFFPNQSSILQHMQGMQAVLGLHQQILLLHSMMHTRAHLNVALLRAE